MYFIYFFLLAHRQLRAKSRNKVWETFLGLRYREHRGPMMMMTTLSLPLRSQLGETILQAQIGEGQEVKALPQVNIHPE